MARRLIQSEQMQQGTRRLITSVPSIPEQKPSLLREGLKAFAGGTEKVLGGALNLVGGKTLMNIGQEAGMALRGEPSLPAQEQYKRGGQALQDIASLGLIAGGLPIIPAGAVIGAGTRITEGETAPGKIATGAAIGATAGAVAQGATKVVGKIINYIFLKKPERIMNSAIKPTLNELKKASKTKADTLGKELLNRDVYGSPEKLLNTAQRELIANENKLQIILQNSTKEIKKSELGSYLKDIFKKYALTPGLKGEAQSAMKVYSELPETMTLPVANEIKRNIYSKLNDIAYKLDPSLSTVKETQKVVAHGLKDLIEKKAAQEGAEEAIKLLNKELAIYGRLQDRIVDLLSRSQRNNIFSLTNAILGGAAGVWGGVPGAIGVVGGRGILGSPTFKTTLAHILNKGAKAGESALTPLIKSFGRGGTAAIIKKLTQ